MRWFVLGFFADRSFSPDHVAKTIIVIRPETFIASGHSVRAIHRIHHVFQRGFPTPIGAARI
jgi:hypothetical protein